MFQQAYVLHAKPYRESSLICQLLTEQDGLVAVMAHKQKFHNPYQVFTPLNLSLKPGHGDLFYIDKLDSEGTTYPLKNHHLYSAYYVNELIVKLVKDNSVSAELFDTYQLTLEALNLHQEIEPVLRSFELKLLDNIGLMPDLSCNAETGQPLADGVLYHVQPDLGIVNQLTSRGLGLTKTDIEQIAMENKQDTHALKSAKRLMRHLINYHLHGQVLKSRKMFISS